MAFKLKEWSMLFVAMMGMTSSLSSCAGNEEYESKEKRSNTLIKIVGAWSALGVGSAASYLYAQYGAHPGYEVKRLARYSKITGAVSAVPVLSTAAWVIGICSGNKALEKLSFYPFYYTVAKPTEALYTLDSKIEAYKRSQSQ